MADIPLLTQDDDEDLQNERDSDNSSNAGNWVDMFINRTEGAANYSRLLGLLIDEGTRQFERYMLNHLPEGCSSLEDAVQQHEGDLRRLRQSKLRPEHMRILFPAFGGINMKAINISLWYSLIRNLSTALTQKEWEAMEKRAPLERQQRPEHDIMRLRNMRNQLCHLFPPKIDTNTFLSQWEYLKQILLRLGTSPDAIERCWNQIPDHKQTLNYVIQLKEEQHRDVETAYKHERKRKWHLQIGLATVAVLICLSALSTCFVLYHYSRTWMSCINSMKFKITGGWLSYLACSIIVSASQSNGILRKLFCFS